MLIVANMIHVLSAIELDDKLPFNTCEIGDIAADGHLAAEAITGKLAPTQSVPEVMLRIGRPFS